MTIQFKLVRPDDLLNLRVRGENLRLNADDPKYPILEVENAEKPGYLILTFPPQTIAERAYFEAPILPSLGQDPTSGVPADPDAGQTQNDPELHAPGYADSRSPAAMLGRPSRLVFIVPPGHAIPFTMEGVLDWTGLTLNVNPIAAIGREPSAEQIAAAPGIERPKATETVLELPYRLMISPTADVAWNHRLLPFTHRGRTELWHTRLQRRDEAGEVSELTGDNTAPLRAIWSPDFDLADPPEPTQDDPDLGRTAMSPNDRHQIVILTSAFHGFLADKKVNFSLGMISPALNTGGAGAFTDVVIGAGGGLGAGSLSRLPKASFTVTVPYVPKPFEARQVMLSPLGGWLKSRGEWTPPYRWLLDIDTTPHGPIFDDIFSDVIVMDEGPIHRPALADRFNAADVASLNLPHQLPKTKDQLDLSEWVHIGTQGRDHYVRIVYEGELWPFRHPAALVKITERKFKEAHGIIGAYLIQRMFIVVRDPVRNFGERDLPFKTVRLTTLVTPDIAEPDVIIPTKRSFWVEVLTAPNTPTFFQFHAVGTDHAGETVDFTIPMMFVSISDLPLTASMDAVAKAYNAADKFEARQAVVPGQKVTFAARNEAVGAATDNTQLVTESLNFVVNADLAPPDLLKAAVKIPQVNELLGTDAATDIRYYQNYVKDGFDAATGVFAEIARYDPGLYKPEDPFAGILAETLGVDFQAQQAGGFATPNMAVSTLTRELGPVAGKAADALLDTFDPAEFFGDGLAFLFGTFDLAKLIPGGSLGQNAPHMTVKTEDIPGGKKVVVCLDWNPPLQEELNLIIAKFMRDQPTASEFNINGCIEKEIKLDGSAAAEPTFEMHGKLTNFQVSILSIVFINFREFGFTSRSGQKTDVTVKLDPETPVAFDGDLKFVEELRKAIPPDLFGDGPSLDITGDGIRVGFAFALPPISVGVFSLRDVSLGAALTLPFLSGKPVFDFNVSERQQPFLLSVGIFGGGGFFRLQLDTAGMKLLEAAFEFGVTAALDIGVASGEVHMTAGIYFALQRKEETDPDLTAVLSGYLRVGGSMEVLGIIKVSVEFNLSFTYDSGTDKAFGRATLTVHVEVLFFSASVELTVERAFGGESGDPVFGEIYDTAEKWNRYALAFA